MISVIRHILRFVFKWWRHGVVVNTLSWSRKLLYIGPDYYLDG